MKSMIPYRVKYFFRKYFTKPAPNSWSGNYSSWAEAQAKCTGYDASNILEKVRTAIVKVKSGESAYERDSMNFDEIQYSKLLSDALVQIGRGKEGIISLIDFGGSLGSSYFQNRNFLNTMKRVDWTVVEQKHFVECGQKYIADENLRFNYTIEEALKEKKANALLLASVVQYFDDPYELISKCLGYDFEYIIIDRTGFIEGNKERITVQTVPEEIYKASYPAWFLNEKKFRAAFENKYELLNDMASEAAPAMLLEDRKKAYWKGFFYKRKHG